jgi:hypothetical protein
MMVVAEDTHAHRHIARGSMAMQKVALAIVAVVAVLAALYLFLPGQEQAEHEKLFSSAGSSQGLFAVTATGSPTQLAGGDLSSNYTKQLQYRGRRLTGEFTLVRSFQHDPHAFT